MRVVCSRPRGLLTVCLLSAAVAVASGGSVLSTLPYAKTAGTCDALFSAQLSTGMDKQDNASAVDAFGLEAAGGNTVSTVDEGIAAADATSDDTRVLQDAAGGRLGVVKPVVDCESLLDVDLTHIVEEGGATVTSAVETSLEGHMYCVVEGTLPASTKWEVMLPVRTWTQRYMQIGCGGLCGNIRMQANAASGSQQVAGGEFALVATDMGGSMDGKVFANNPDRRKSVEFFWVTSRSGINRVFCIVLGGSSFYVCDPQK